MHEALLLVWTPWQAVRLLRVMSAAGQQQWLWRPLLLLPLSLLVEVLMLLQQQHQQQLSQGEGHGRGVWYRDQHGLALADALSWHMLNVYVVDFVEDCWSWP